jgi:hypothetical protein
MNNGKGSKKGDLRFSNLRVSNKDDLRSNNQGNNLRRGFGNRKDKSKDLRFSNHDPLSLKENQEVGSIEVEKAGSRWFYYW